MKVVLYYGATNASRELTVAKNELVISLKTAFQESFHEMRGKLIQLFVAGSSTELADEHYIGDYHSIRNSTRIEVVLPVAQPFSEVDYGKIQERIEKDLVRKKLEDFFDPTEDENDWIQDWTKGDEYLNYPPVDVYGTQSEALTKAANNGTIDKFRDLNEYLEKVSARNQLPDAGRNFQSIYICEIDNFRFSFLHKFEGKWSGSAIHFSTNGKSSPIEHASSAKFVFDPRRKCWMEQQCYTHSNGLSSARLFSYTPIADGACEVVTDDPRMTENVVMKLSEQSHEALLLTGINMKTGNIVLTETIVMSSHMSSEKRIRTITRFDSKGRVAGVAVCTEHKVIDEESGALGPSMF